jgi:hypothetical protein
MSPFRILSVPLLSMAISSGFASMVQETRELSPFTAVRVSGPIQLEVRQTSQAEHLLEIEIRKDLLSQLSAKVEQDTLHLELKTRRGQRIRSKDVQLRISASMIESLRLDGSGDIFGGALQAGELTLHLAGAGDIRFGSLAVSGPFSAILRGAGDIRVDKVDAGAARVDLHGAGDIHFKQLNAASLHARLTGAGDVRASGTVAEQTIEVRGAGDFIGRHLAGERVTVTLAGAGRTSVSASQSLDATISGAGSITYAGTPPEVQQRVTGAGSIRRAR